MFFVCWLRVSYEWDQPHPSLVGSADASLTTSYINIEVNTMYTAQSESGALSELNVLPSESSLLSVRLKGVTSTTAR